MSADSDMAVFARVVETGGFAPAARALAMTPSAVSKAVARLEDRLGARLLNRTTRKVSLTEVGAAYHQRAVAILADIDAAEGAVREHQTHPTGVLRVNSAIAYAEFRVLPMLPVFLERYPDLSVRLTMYDHKADLIAEGYDIGLRLGAMTESSLIARKLAPTDRVVFGAPSYIERFGRPETPEDLQDHNCVSFSFDTPANTWEFDGPGGRRSIRVAGNFQSNSASALYAAARSGVGLFRAARFVPDADLRAGRLVPVLEDYTPAEDAVVYAVWPHSRHLSPKVRAFIDFLVEIESGRWPQPPTAGSTRRR
jgi:DNA-binding transcriptional LysR family regulator